MCTVRLDYYTTDICTFSQNMYIIKTAMVFERNVEFPMSLVSLDRQNLHIAVYREIYQDLTYPPEEPYSCKNSEQFFEFCNNHAK